MPDELSTPKDVSEYLLARTGEAMMRGDFTAFARCFSLPYEMETVDGRRRIETRSSLRLTFDAVHAHLVKQQVTLMARHCVSASFRGADEVVATHETRLISRDILVQEPYPAFSILRRSKTEDWKIAFTSYVIMDSAELNSALNA
ncbi:hypothetical protein [uncultured Tateyamaria sp.]|uniref:hypothetical protein n=1 Tax=uncultured Tateyamaria sp. TaxID=455651 RepID=UPI0026293708|nr:hypothetical protein [uncultured Tateyamaria sp.]